MDYIFVFFIQVIVWVIFKYLAIDTISFRSVRNFKSDLECLRHNLPASLMQWAIAIAASISAPAVFLGVNYFWSITMDPKCWFIWIELFLTALIALIIYTDEYDDDGPVTAIIILISSLVIGILCLMYTWDNFHTKKVRNLLTVEEFDESLADSIVSPIPLEKMCVVSPEVAKRAVLTKMGDLKNTYEVGTFTKQAFTGKFIATTNDGQKVQIDYQDQLIYVAPLEHKGFWTWNSKGFSEAFALVDATDADKCFVITAVNDKPVKMYYTEQAYLNNMIRRHLRLNGYAFKKLGGFRMELDENGHPFSPRTVLKNSIGTATQVVEGVAVTDMETGEIRFYKPDEAPAFINCIQPMSLIYQRIKTWGEYKNGYFHWSNKTGLMEPCEGGDMVQTPYGCCYYIGVKALSDTTGTKGYMLVDTRSGKARFFPRNGISEAEAIRVFEAITTANLNIQVKSGTVTLTEPLFYNVQGLKSYFTTYVSTRDLTVKYFAFCSTEDKTIWGHGTTMDEALSAYITANYRVKAEKNRKIQVAEKQAYVTVQGKVLEKVAEGSAYFIKLEGRDETFYGYSSFLPEIRWSTKEVEITYNQTDAKMIAIADYKVIN